MAAGRFVMMQVPEPIRRFWRQTVAPRPIAAGSAGAVAAGLAVGAYLAAGAGFEPPPPMKPAPRGAAHRLEAAPQPITLMKDANGRTPDWVIGTDNIPGRAPARQPVLTVPDEEDEAAAPRRGLGWLLPWRWGRDEPREAEPPRPSRRISSYRENQAAAAAAERAERERDRQRRYAEAEEAEIAAMEEERRYRPRYDPRDEPRYEPRYEPRDQPRYAPREEEAELYEDEPPPPPERWRYGR